MNRPRLAVVCDFAEEQWPSMDLVAEMLLAWLADTAGVSAARVCPPFRRRFSRLPLLGRRPSAFNADRACNRHWDYPRHLRRQHAAFDFFHVVDHSYAHLVHGLPAGRAGVFCHDLDTFRCLLWPQCERRPFWFRALVRRTLRGLQQAAVVFYSTAAVRSQIEQLGLVDPARLVAAPYGPAEEFTSEPGKLDRTIPILTDWGDSPFLLHVGSCVPRKRIDVLLDVFAAVRSRCPGLRLVQVGGPWQTLQRQQMVRLGIEAAVCQIQGLERSTLAALYRRAAVVLQPSEREGFGLPVLEALACGAVVVASDIPSLREVGGAAARFAPVGDVAAWSQHVAGLLDRPETAPPVALRLQQAARFSWSAHARIVGEAYQRLAR